MCMDVEWLMLKMERLSMNERIRELREHAWTLVSNEERDRGALYDAREQWERCDQKFAELIVRECLSNMEDCDGDLEFAIWKTKTEFGIE